jgi:excisionase family DNA binding protein
MAISVGNTIAYDLEELAEKLNVSERTLRRYIRAGKLQAFKLGLKYHVTQRALDEYFDTSSQAWE